MKNVNRTIGNITAQGKTFFRTIENCNNDQENNPICLLADALNDFNQVERKSLARQIRQARRMGWRFTFDYATV